MKFIIYSMAAVLLIIYVYFVCKCKKPIKHIAKYALGGVGSLMVVNLFSGVTGVGVGVNLLTVACSALFGSCGTILMLVIKLI